MEFKIRISICIWIEAGLPFFGPVYLRSPTHETQILTTIIGIWGVPAAPPRAPPTAKQSNRKTANRGNDTTVTLENNKNVKP